MSKHRAHRYLYASSIFLSIGFGGCSSTEEIPGGDAAIAPPSVISTPGKRTTLAPGDRIEVFVLEDNKFNGIYQVREGGDIILPLVGRVQVTGNSPKSAESVIQGRLQPGQLTKATVIVDRISAASDPAKADSGKVEIYLSGRVVRSGQHKIAPNRGMLGASEALLISGGADRFGDESKAYIMRRSEGGTQVRIPVNLRAIQEGRVKDVPVVSGDIIVVPEKSFVF